MITSSSAPKALQGGGMKKVKGLASVVKQDKKMDAKMTPAQLKQDIAADKKLLASKVKKK